MKIKPIVSILAKAFGIYLCIQAPAHAGFLDDLSSSVKESVGALLNKVNENLPASKPQLTSQQVPPATETANLSSPASSQPTTTAQQATSQNSNLPSAVAQEVSSNSTSVPVAASNYEIAQKSELQNEPPSHLPTAKPALTKPIRQVSLKANEQRMANCRHLLSEKNNLLSRIQDRTTSNLQKNVNRQKADIGLFGKLLGQDKFIDRAAQNPMFQANLGQSVNTEYFNELEKISQQCLGLGLAAELLPIADELMVADPIPQVPGMFSVSSPKYRHSAALIYGDAGRTEQAVSIYRGTLNDNAMLQLAAMNPQPILDALRQLANIYLTQGKRTEAVALYDDFFQLNKNLVTGSQMMQLTLYKDAAAVYSKVGLHEKAAISLETTKSLLDSSSSGQMGKNGQSFITAMSALSGAFQGASEMARVLNIGNPLIQTADIRSNLDIESASTDKVYLMLGYEYVALGRNSDLKRLYEVEYKKFIEISRGKYNGAPTFTKGTEGFTEIMPLRGTLNFARMFAQRGMHNEASLAYREAVRLGQLILLQRWLHFAVVEQSNRFNLQLYKTVIGEYLSWVTNFGTSDASANDVAEAYTQLLQFKGSLADFDSALASAVRNRKDPELSATLTEIASISERLDSVDKAKLYTPNNSTVMSAYIGDMNKRAALVSKLQTAIADDVEKTFVSKRTDDLFNNLVHAIPRDAAFIDIVKLPDLNIAGQDEQGQYIAFITRPGQSKPNLVKLGDSKTIESLVSKYQTTIRAALDSDDLPAEQALNEIGRKLHKQIIEPLSGQIVAAGSLVISPDAALQLIPFEVFVSPEGRFIVQDVAVSYVSKSGQAFNESSV